MITLRAERLHWIGDDGNDDPNDLCAHSPVTCKINDESIASPDDGDWTVSASAIFLLRSLDREHTKKAPVGDQIFPCCGHGIYDVGDEEVVICGCPNGIDFEIRHGNQEITLSLDDDRQLTVTREEWEQAVLGFSDQILRFYDNSAQKDPGDEESKKGFKAMMAEWHRLHSKRKNQNHSLHG